MPGRKHKSHRFSIFLFFHRSTIHKEGELHILIKRRGERTVSEETDLLRYLAFLGRDLVETNLSLFALGLIFLDNAGANYMSVDNTYYLLETEDVYESATGTSIRRERVPCVSDTVSTSSNVCGRDGVVALSETGSERRATPTFWAAGAVSSGQVAVGRVRHTSPHSVIVAEIFFLTQVIPTLSSSLLVAGRHITHDTS